MLKLLASILIALNPVVGFFTINSRLAQDASQKEAPLVIRAPINLQTANNGQNYKLPLEADTFLITKYLPIFPVRNWTVSDPTIQATTALVLDSARQEILYQKNGLHESHPIASLTKLMTALVAMENADLNSVFKISKEAVQTEGEMGDMVVGEKLTVKSLLYILLVSSSNDAAVALAENIPFPPNGDTKKIFVDLMNKKAVSLELKNTSFADPSGLDPNNYSSAWDISLMLKEALRYPLLQEVMQTKTIDLHSLDGRFNHHLVSTDKLLGVIPEIVGGKTGYTEEAGNCMTVAFRSPDNEGSIVIVVMNSPDRAAEIKSLFGWTKKAYLW